MTPTDLLPGHYYWIAFWDGTPPVLMRFVCQHNDTLFGMACFEQRDGTPYSMEALWRRPLRRCEPAAPLVVLAAATQWPPFVPGRTLCPVRFDRFVVGGGNVTQRHE